MTKHYHSLLLNTPFGTRIKVSVCQRWSKGEQMTHMWQSITLLQFVFVFFHYYYKLKKKEMKSIFANKDKNQIYTYEQHICIKLKKSAIETMIKERGFWVVKDISETAIKPIKQIIWQHKQTNKQSQRLADRTTDIQMDKNKRQTFV